MAVAEFELTERYFSTLPGYGRASVLECGGLRMAVAEFELIERYFNTLPGYGRAPVLEC